MSPVPRSRGRARRRPTRTPTKRCSLRLFVPEDTPSRCWLARTHRAAGVAAVCGRRRTQVALMSMDFASTSGRGQPAHGEPARPPPPEDPSDRRRAGLLQLLAGHLAALAALLAGALPVLLGCRSTESGLRTTTKAGRWAYSPPTYPPSRAHCRRAAPVGPAAVVSACSAARPGHRCHVLPGGLHEPGGAPGGSAGSFQCAAGGEAPGRGWRRRRCLWGSGSLALDAGQRCRRIAGSAAN